VSLEERIKQLEKRLGLRPREVPEISPENLAQMIIGLADDWPEEERNKFYAAIEAGDTETMRELVQRNTGESPEL